MSSFILKLEGSIACRVAFGWRLTTTEPREGVVAAVGAVNPEIVEPSLPGDCEEELAAESDAVATVPGGENAPSFMGFFGYASL